MRPAGSDSKKDGKPIAFLMEGTWWEKEAEIYFDEVVEDTKDNSQAYGRESTALYDGNRPYR